MCRCGACVACFENCVLVGAQRRDTNESFLRAASYRRALAARARLARAWKMFVTAPRAYVRYYHT